MPKTLSDEHRMAFAERLAEYVRDRDVKECFVVLHGGEPLLAGADAIASFVQGIRDAIGESAKVEFGMQTNGLLLTDAALDALQKAGVIVSLSLDGPRDVNDLHRTTRKGRSSFDRVEAALERLQRRPQTFAGVIAVIDPRASPETLFSFFDQYQIPRLDFLLPDAHHLRPPPGRVKQPALYREWLIRAFDLWLDHYPHLPVRFFETLLDSAAGLPSQTDAIGFGDVSLLSIETDGSYHDLDVLKVVGEGVSALAGNVSDRAIADVAASPAIEAHRRLLTKEGLCDTCRSCRVVEICGGGSVPHRHGPDGFNHPSVYCDELFSLIEHVTSRLNQTLGPQARPTSRLPSDFDFTRFDMAERAMTQVDALSADAEAESVVQFRSALEIAKAFPDASASVSVLSSLSPEAFRRAASWPGAVAWTAAYLARNAGKTVLDVDGRVIPVDADYLDALVATRVWLHKLETVQTADAWLRYPFGDAIFFEGADISDQAGPLVSEALKIIEQWRPTLAAELRQTSKTVLFIRDPTAHPEKIVSFSDNSVPGALFVSVWQGDRFIDPYDLADSLIHEHRHQKLYLLERFAPMVRSSMDLVVSPWREDLRPPSGLLHAIFVFVELRRFWRHVRDEGPERLHERAIDQLEDTDRNLDQAFATLATCALSEAGQQLAKVLDRARRDALASAA